MDYPWNADVTEIIPVNAFGGLADEPSGRSHPFATDAQVLAAPELDDVNDLAHEWPHLLIAPSTTTGSSSSSRNSIGGPHRHAARASTPRPAAAAARHRRTPSTTHRKSSGSQGAGHCRLIIAAVAGGAAAAGAVAAGNASEVQANPAVLASATTAATGDLPPSDSGMQIVQVASTSDSAVHSEELARGTAFAQERAQREARMRRPQFVSPTQGIMTSGFGTRWGTLHGGLDIANAIGTPIYAASDGEVVAAGPTPGFGMWVKIRDANGTVTLYGHIDTATVQAGERVLAGDQIATMGNRGNSTGPHLHFEVHRNGTEKIDPVAWLQERGVPNA